MINQTIFNPGPIAITESDCKKQDDVQLTSKDPGVWAHYWDGNLHPILRSFVIPKN